MKYIAVVTTFKELAEARTAARVLVERGLVASSHISEIESFFIWQGTLREEKEFKLVCETRGERYPAIEFAIRELHSYELPDIHAYALEAIYAPYAEWLESRLSDRT